MDSWDVYCAICGACFGGCQWRKRRTRHPPQNEEGSKLPEDGSEDEPGYDPKVISEEDAAWVATLRVLGFNPNAPGVKKAFVSGQGDYWDYGFVGVLRGDDPNFPEGTSGVGEHGITDFTCYCPDDLDEHLVVPFHDECFQVLCNAIAITVGRRVDHDVLYTKCAELCENWSYRLNLDYGDPEPPCEQFWVSESGQEVLVANPLRVSWLPPYLESAPVESAVHNGPGLDLHSKVIKDPFRKLPYDILYDIFDLLPGESVGALRSASWPAHCAKLPNAFWREKILFDRPWAFEIEDAFSPFNAPSVAYKRLYFHLNQITQLNKPGCNLGLTNRRRIWGVCDQLIELYRKGLSNDDGSNQTDNVDEYICENAKKSQHMPAVSFPPPRSVENISTF
jgi:hypothetical protein